MPNHGRPTRQKSMKRDGGGNPQTNGGTSHQPSSPSEGSHNYNHSSPKPNFGGGSDSFGRETIQNHGNRESGSRNASGDHPQPRNSFRRGGGGSHSRGDGAHQNYGGRRGDQDRGNHDWNHQRSFNGRDAQRVSPRAYVRPPPAGVAAPFAAPPMRPTFINPCTLHKFKGNLEDFYIGGRHVTNLNFHAFFSGRFLFAFHDFCSICSNCSTCSTSRVSPHWSGSFENNDSD